jgi:hypothetical protein
VRSGDGRQRGGYGSSGRSATGSEGDVRDGDEREEELLNDAEVALADDR